MGIGGEGGGGEFGDLGWAPVVSSHRVGPVLASNPTSLHSHIHPIISMGESGVIATAKPLLGATTRRTAGNGCQGLENTHGILFTIYSCSSLPFFRPTPSVYPPRLPRLGQSRPRSATALVNNHPRDLGIPDLSLRPHLGVPFALLAVRHDPHGVLGDVGTGSRNGLGAVVAPADSAFQATRKLHARVCSHAAVFGSLAHGLDLALHSFCEHSVAELLAALGSLVLWYGQRESSWWLATNLSNLGPLEGNSPTRLSPCLPSPVGRGRDPGRGV